MHHKESNSEQGERLLADNSWQYHQLMVHNLTLAIGNGIIPRHDNSDSPSRRPVNTQTQTAPVSPKVFETKCVFEQKISFGFGLGENADKVAIVAADIAELLDYLLWNG